jgi:hypothetical protein
LLVSFLIGVESLCCGKVYDGPNYLEDIQWSKAHHRIFASWTGFTGDCTIGSSTSTGIRVTRRPSIPKTQTRTPYGVSGRAHSSTGAFGNNRNTKTPGVTYQVAVISEALATTAILSSGNNATQFSPRCRISTGLGQLPNGQRVRPDIVDWKFVSTNTTYINLNVSLHSGIKYYVIVRAHIQGTTGRTVYSNSDGWTPFDHGADDDDGGDDDDEDDDDDGDEDDDGNEFDDGNDDSDDDSGLRPYQSGLIAMGCALGCLLCLCLLLLLVFATRRGEDKYTTTVHRNENVDKL